MIKDDLIALYSRDLNRLIKEIGLYSSESKLWLIEGEIKNSAGNLCLHIIGNLKTFIGNGLCNIGYVRERELEFSAKNINRELLFDEIEEVLELIKAAFSPLQAADLLGKYPIIIWEKEQGMIYTLMKLHAHLNYHLGQINYHRRLIDL